MAQAVRGARAVAPGRPLIGPSASARATLEHALDKLSRLDRLRIAEEYLAWQLTRLRATIRDLEQEERASHPPATPPPRPEWTIQYARTRDKLPVGVHHGDCPMGSGKSISRDQARRALTEGVEPCPFCRPDTELGI
ncbi:DUF6233 domain-containing protein [Streptomyces sp. P1-3]|uniref:DUF6233 domain-containing protein n=1 Tax=Streptomyces sp. P1-3 TaxID=3421658 RepID=UPI003D35A63D